MSDRTKYIVIIPFPHGVFNGDDNEGAYGPTQRNDAISV